MYTNDFHTAVSPITCTCTCTTPSFIWRAGAIVASVFDMLVSGQDLVSAIMLFP